MLLMAVDWEGGGFIGEKVSLSLSLCALQLIKPIRVLTQWKYENTWYQIKFKNINIQRWFFQKLNVSHKDSGNCAKYGSTPFPMV